MTEPTVVEDAWLLPGVPDRETATDIVRTFCGWHIAPSRTETVVLDTVGGRVLFLPSTHVTGVGEVRVDDAAPLTYKQDFRWSAKGMISRARGSVWPDDFQAVSVTFTHGYADPPKAIVEVASALGKRLPALGLGRSSEGSGGVTISYDTAARALFDVEKQILAAFTVGGEL